MSPQDLVLLVAVLLAAAILGSGPRKPGAHA